MAGFALQLPSLEILDAQARLPLVGDLEHLAAITTTVLESMILELAAQPKAKGTIRAPIDCARAGSGHL